MLNHTGGTYSHSGIIDYPRFPISELHLGKFPDSMEFQSWKVNFMTEVCSKTVDPHLTMHWIKEVEMGKSMDEHMTSQLITGRRDFTDFDMLDAMIVSALKRLLDLHIHFRKRESVEEQRAQKKKIDSYEGDKLRTWSTSISVQPVPLQQYKVCQIYSINAYRMMTFRISIQ